MATPPPVRIQLRKIDDEEFTAHPWGELEEGEIVKRYDEAEELFGPFDEIVAESIEMMPPDADPANPLEWLHLWHNYGRQAHHPRADVIHPTLNRHLWGMDEAFCVGAVQGFTHPDSRLETISVLYHGDGGESTTTATGTPLVARYQVPEADDLSDLTTQETIAATVHPTVANVIRFTTQIRTFEALPPRLELDRIIVVAEGLGRVLCRVEMTVEQAEAIDWDTHEPDTLVDDAAVYYSIAKGWHRDVTDRYDAYTQAIDAAASFTDLLSAVARHGRIQGSTTEYSAADLSGRFQAFREAARAGTPPEEVDFTTVTRTLGLRGKCIELYREILED
jgi:hypothetical protein